MLFIFIAGLIVFVAVLFHKVITLNDKLGMLWVYHKYNSSKEEGEKFRKFIGEE